MIAFAIYNGMTADQIGLTEENYRHRKEVVDRFVAQWGGIDFEGSYREWVRTQPEGNSPQEIKKQETQEHETPTRCCDKPSTKDMAAGVASAVGRFTASGFKWLAADDPVYLSRWAICEPCEFLLKNRCYKCGCYMKLKARLPRERCKIGKW